MCTEQSFSCSVTNAKTYTSRRSACAATLAASQLPYRVQDYSHHVQSVKIWSTSLSCWLVDLTSASSCYEIRRSMLSSSAVPNSQISSWRFRYAAPSIWNLLPPNLRINETVPAVKTGLKTYNVLVSLWMLDWLSRASEPPGVLAP